MNLNDYRNAPKEGTVNGQPALIWYLQYAHLPSDYRLYRFLDGSIKVRDLSCGGYDNVSEPVWRPIPEGAKVEEQVDLP